MKQLLLLLFLAAGCVSTYRNDTPVLPPEKLAQLKQSGFVFRISGTKDRHHYDEMWLTPGDYVFDFLMPASGDTGFARCVVAAGKRYKFSVGESRYLPEIGKTALIGQCAAVEK